MFDFKSIKHNEAITIATLDGYIVRFTASERNTHINGRVLVNEAEQQYRSSGCKFYHYDTSLATCSALIIGGNDRDCGGQGYDIMGWY